jgi:hypothetical protein
MRKNIMKKYFAIQTIGVGAVALALAFLAAGCETVNKLTELGTGIAVASGSITTNEANSINRTTQAVTKTFQDITPEQEYYIGRTVAATVLPARHNACVFLRERQGEVPTHGSFG